jgi:PAS domain S-box-containing protein
MEYLDYLPEAVKRVLEQVRTEKRLALSEARLGAIIASARDAIITVEADGRISLFNAAAEQMFRCPGEMATGQHIRAFIPREAFTAPREGDHAPGNPLDTGDVGRRTDGSAFPIEATVSLVEAAGPAVYAVVVRDVTERHEYIRMIRRAHEETIHRLLAVSAFRDTETGAHIRRTGLFSEALARAAGWQPSRAEELRMAATMHDIGKVGIPDAILRKPGRLTDEESRIMQTHALLGAKMLGNPQSYLMRLAQQIALAHHERWDGRGYPYGLAGTDIPECARIVAIVDVYDALAHDRVYRPACSEPEVISMLLEGRGTHFDPHLLDCFLGAFDEIRTINEAHPDGAAEETTASDLSRPAEASQMQLATAE